MAEIWGSQDSEGKQNDLGIQKNKFQRLTEVITHNITFCPVGTQVCLQSIQD